MIEIKGSDVDTVFSEALVRLYHEGVEEQSRNGPVLVFPTPVMTTYTQPLNRVLFSPMRDANPFFHLMEALWMLAGRNDVEFVSEFNSRIDQFSDDSEHFHGAYGFRWRHWFGDDQLDYIASMLIKDPNSRRAVLTMWAPAGDLWHADAGIAGGPRGKDVPCNTQIYFDRRGGRLNMTVLNRSNDLIWGCYGANVVHFSFLLEYMAALIDCPVGVYRQFSNNLHVYTNQYPKEKLLDMSVEASSYGYRARLGMQHIPLVKDWRMFNNELVCFVEEKPTCGSEDFLWTVADPMMSAWYARKAGDKARCYEDLNNMPNCDWKVAALAWCRRRDLAPVGAPGAGGGSVGLAGGAQGAALAPPWYGGATTPQGQGAAQPSGNGRGPVGAV